MNTLTSFFAGIMAFISSIFGQHAQVPVQPVVNQPVEQVTQVINSQNTQIQASTSVATTSVFVQKNNLKTEKLVTYRNGLFGYEIQYPEKWTVRYDKGTVYLDDPFQKDIKNEPSTVLSISAHYFNVDYYRTLNDWTKGDGYMFFGNQPGQSTGSLNGKETRELIVDKCGKYIAVLHEGVVFLFQYVDKGFVICKSDLDAIGSVVASFKVVLPKTLQDIARTTFWLDGPYSARLLEDNKTELVNNDLVATIKSRSYSYPSNIVYTTKDKNKVYFVNCKETFGGCAWTYLKYLDRVDGRYYSPTIPYGNDVLQSGKYLVTHGYGNKIFISDLEQGKGRFMYGKNDSESYISACAVGDFGEESLEDIEFTNDNRLRIGVYKNIGQGDNNKCSTDAVNQWKANLGPFKYEKIRDDYIDLSKF